MIGSGKGSETVKAILLGILGIAVIALVLKSPNAVPLLNAAGRTFTGSLAQAQKG